RLISPPRLRLVTVAICTAIREGGSLGDVRFGSHADICSAKPHSSPIATSIAFFGMSALGQKRTLRDLIDYFVGAAEQRRKHSEAERFGGLEVDHKLILGRRLHRQIGGFLTFEDTIHVTSGEAVLVNPISSIGDQ